MKWIKLTEFHITMIITVASGYWSKPHPRFSEQAKQLEERSIVVRVHSKEMKCMVYVGTHKARILSSISLN